MAKKGAWGRVAVPYKRRFQPASSATASTAPGAMAPPAPRQPDVSRALFRFRATMDRQVWTTALLEGTTFTLPEVVTLLEAKTVGGHSTAEQDQVLAIAEANRSLADMVEKGEFELTKAISDRINGIVARHEAIEAGHFRGEGSAQGGGIVNVPGQGKLAAPETGAAGANLRNLHAALIRECAQIEEPHLAAAHYFCGAVRAQFYFDGNKRTARLMANGMLMNAGHDAWLIPQTARLDYNDALTALFTDADEGPLTEVLLRLAL